MSKGRGWSVFWRKDRARWAVEYVDATGRWTQKAVDHAIPRNAKRAAEQWAETWIAEQKIGEKRARAQAGALTVEDLREKWIALRWEETRRQDDRALAPSTVKNNETHFKTHITPTIGDRVVADLDVVACRKWVRELRARLKSGSMVRNVHGTFAAFLDGVIGEGWVKLPANPAKQDAVRHELPAINADHDGLEDVVHVPIADAQRLIDGEPVPPYRRVKYAIGFCLGMRASEIYGLTWADVDLESDVPTIAVKRACANYGPEGYASLRKTKSRKSKRKLPLHPCVAAALREWRQLWEAFAAKRALPSSPIIPNDKGEHMRAKDAKQIRADLARLGLETTCEGKPIDFHSTRRTFATALKRAGVDESMRKRLLGHSSGGNVTEEHYTAGDLEAALVAVSKIPLEWASFLPPVTSAGSTPIERMCGLLGSAIATTTLGNRCSNPLSYGGSAEKLRAIVASRKERREKSERRFSSTLGLRTTSGEAQGPSDGAVDPPEKTFAELLDEALAVDPDDVFDEIEKGLHHLDAERPAVTQ